MMMMMSTMRIKWRKFFFLLSGCVFYRIMSCERISRELLSYLLKVVVAVGEFWRIIFLKAINDFMTQTIVKILLINFFQEFLIYDTILQKLIDVWSFFIEKPPDLTL